MTVTEEVGLLARRAVDGFVHGGAAAVKERLKAIAPFGRGDHQVGRALGVDLKGPVEVVGFGNGEVQHEVEVCWHLVELAFGEIDRNRDDPACLDGLAGGCVAVASGAVHRVACRRKRRGKWSGDPTCDAGDQDPLAGDGGDVAHAITTTGRCRCRYRRRSG
jgi:hypothetical protein